MMDSGSGRSVHESVEDNDEFKKISVKSGNGGESLVYDNGSCELGNSDKNNRNSSDVKGKGTEVSGPENSPSVEVTPGVSSPTPSSTKKGFGLKKWKRIKRDVNKSGENRPDSGKMVIQDLSELVVNPSKRAQVYAERPQKSEGSVSSASPLVGNLDFVGVLGDSYSPIGPSIDAGADSENSEDQSSKSSTAASIPKVVKYDKSRMRSLSGKNLTHSVHRAQQGKVRIEAMKKARGDQVKIKEENSHSSMESDLRSSNFVFMQGTYATNNERQSDEPVYYDGEYGDEGKGSEQQVNDGLRRGYRKDGEGGYEGVSPEDGSADSYWKVKAERTENRSSSNQDPLVESIIALQSAQEALEKEVLKLKEISSDASVDDLVSDAHPLVTAAEQKVKETSSAKFPFGVGIATAKEYAETELEDLFKRKIAAEVEYLTISKTICNLRAAVVNQTANLEGQNTSASEQNQVLRKSQDSKNEDLVLKTQSVKLENFYEDLASANEILKLQKKLCKYASYFFIQLLCFLIVLGFVISQLSLDYEEVVPT